VTELAPPPPLTTRSPAEIQADIDRAVAGLRALRARQAGAHFADRPGLAARIQAVQDKLDRLYEEKRAAHVIAGRTRRQHGNGHSANPVEVAPEHGHATGAHLIARLFSDSTGQP
jgi:hypothetical protein